MKPAAILLATMLLIGGCDTSRDRVEANDAAAETKAVVTNEAPPAAIADAPPR